MSGKVIDFDPSQRLTKEALETMKETVNKLTVKDTEAVTLIITPKGQSSMMFVYGMDFHSIGLAQTLLTALGNSLLADEFSDK